MPFECLKYLKKFSIFKLPWYKVQNQDRQIDRQTNRQTDKQTYRQTDRNAHRQTDRQRDRQNKNLKSDEALKI